MSTSEGHPVIGEQGVLSVPGNYQPVHFEDTAGAILLGIFAILSLIGWMRSEARYRKLIIHKEMTDGSN